MSFVDDLETINIVNSTKDSWGNTPIVLKFDKVGCWYTKLEARIREVYHIVA